MNSSVMGLLKQYLPVGMAAKGLSSVDPRIVSFITGATAAGYGVDMIKDFLKDVTLKGPEKDLVRRQRAKKEAGTARPDEQANLSGGKIAGNIGNAIGAGLTVAGGLGAAGAFAKNAGGALGAAGAVTPEVLPALSGAQQQLQIGNQQAPAQLQQQAPQQPQPLQPEPQQQIPPQPGSLPPQSGAQITPQPSPSQIVPQETTPQRSLKEVGTSILQSKGIQAGEKEPQNRSYFQRAMEGVDFFTLPDTTKLSVGKISKRLNTLESEGVPYKDQSVQKIVKGIKKLIKNSVGLAETESARFNDGYPQAQQQPQQQPQAQQQSNADAQLAQMLDAISQRFKL